MQNLTSKQRALLPCANILHTTKQFKTLKINKDISLISSNAIKTPFIFDRLVLSVSTKLDKKAALLLSSGSDGVYDAAIAQFKTKLQIECPDIEIE